MKSPIRLINKKQTTSFRIVSLLLAIAPLCLILATHAQTPNPSPADWTQFHRDNMQRWNPYETVLGVGNVSSLQLKWKDPIVPIHQISTFPTPTSVRDLRGKFHRSQAFCIPSK
jgi:hypothetical protein